jgi:hypothetical protein
MIEVDLVQHSQTLAVLPKSEGNIRNAIVFVRYFSRRNHYHVKHRYFTKDLLSVVDACPEDALQLRPPELLIAGFPMDYIGGENQATLIQTNLFCHQIAA